MITTYNPNNYAQEIFLRKAYNDLKAQGKLSAQELAAQGFKSIHSYFAHIGDLIQKDTSYLLIPTDESPFEINANTRTIKIPAEFSKCASVVGDNLCEIITFTIDRYFDHVDLAGTEIAVQWKTNKNEGISLIKLIDTETLGTEGKIRFGWPLTKALTDGAGNIVFAVRFYKTDGEQKYTYVLNTLPTTIIVKDSLNLVPGAGTMEEDVNSLFADFITNSNHPSYAVPMTPSFDAAMGGLNLPQVAAINEDNTLDIEARAMVSDGSNINYTWFFKKNALTTLDPIVPINLNLESVKADSNWSINVSYGKVGSTEEIKSAGRERQNIYYYFDDTVNTYVKIDDADVWFVEANNDVDLYVVNQCLHFKDNDSEDICGVYYATVVSSFSDPVQEEVIVLDNDTMENIMINGEAVSDDVTITYNVANPNTSSKVTSRGCCVFPPNEVEITSEFENTVFIPAEADGAAELAVTIAEDSRNPAYNYKWFNMTNLNPTVSESGEWVVAEGEGEALIGETGAAAAISTPGWYRCEVNATLNRATKNASTEICRVVKEPSVPTINELKYKIGDGEFITYTGAIDATEGNRITLKPVLEKDFTSLLESDELIYSWYYGNEENRDYWKKLSVADANADKSDFLLVSYDNDSITVRVKDSKWEAAHFYCAIENKLGDKVASFNDPDKCFEFI